MQNTNAIQLATYETVRAIKYHNYRQRFLSRMHGYVIALIMVMAALLTADLIYHHSQFGVLAAFIGVVFSIDLAENYYRGSKRHRHIKEKLLALQATDCTTAKYRHELACIREGEPEIYCALSAICYNEVCQTNHLVKAMTRITLWQRYTRHVLTWGNTTFFFRPLYNLVNPPPKSL